MKAPVLMLVLGCTAFGQIEVESPHDGHWYQRPLLPYQKPHVPPVALDNSPRLNQLLRAGNLYLSLQDAIALALENNLDVELQRYQPAISSSDLLRAKAGVNTLRGIPYTVNQPPPGIGGPASPLLNLAAASGVTPSTSVPTNLIELSAIIPSSVSSDITQSTYSTGSPVPIFDPAITGSLEWQHQSTPEVSTVVSGSNALIGHNVTGALGYTQAFSLGTQISTNFNAESQTENSLRDTYNPYATSSLGINLTQPLLRGFGIGVNRRFIRIAKNNQKVSDQVFRQQVIETVYGIIRLYYDLVSLGEDVQVKRETLALADRLYQDNKQKVDQGTLAPIELVRAQAQIAAAQQDLANSEGYELQQELIVKTLLSRRGTADAALREARVLATTPIDIPATDDIKPIPELVSEAYRYRPELEEGRLELSNGKITMEGSRNELLPELDLIATAQNSGLAGQSNSLLPAGSAPPSAVGGLGTSVGQIFRNNYPTYGVGIQLNLPLRNRLAQGDYARDEINLRQAEIRFTQLENQIRLEVEGALIAMQRSRAAYEAAVQARKLQEQSLEIELEKYANALSTPFLVTQYESYVAQARSTEVAAKGVYVKARAALERATGETLANHQIALDDVLKGHLSAPPAALPKP
jgi:outer membrane protein